MTWNKALIFIGFLVFYRIFNVFLIQSQFDPDEYWQQLEPAYCHVFASGPVEECPGLTWEWKRRPSRTEYTTLGEFIELGLQGPVRSYASILPTLVFYYCIKMFGLDSSWMVSRGPVFLNAILVAASTDWCIWYLSGFIVQSQKKVSIDLQSRIRKWCIYGSLSSWFMGYALVRTYSNSLETVLLSLSLCFVAPELLGNDSTLPSVRRTEIQRASLAFFLGGISCSIRFTSLTAFIPMGIILAFSRSRSILSRMGYLFGVCAFWGMIGLLVTLILDRHMYGFTAVPFLGNFQFNVVEGKGYLYGSHPFHWYLTAGIPAIAGILTPFLIYSLSRVRGWSRPQRNLWFICAVYVVSHSFSVHKEFRFLLPILPLFCLLCGEHIQNFTEFSVGRRKLMIVGALANLVAVLYLGMFHQRAPIEVNRRILEMVKHEARTYQVHYLMGCHSTPLLSHLHSPPAVIKPWALDCSPSCRADPTVECESERFLRHPEAFVESTYFHCSDIEEGTCVSDLRRFYPDFLVVNSNEVPDIQLRIVTMGMKEVGRFINGISGLRVRGSSALCVEAFDESECCTHSFLYGTFAVCFDEIVLFSTNDIIH